MAKTTKSYRQGGRLPRYTTKLNAFSNGMYLTKQMIPEGYAKVMCNYDIDDTGSHIKPRRGRSKSQTISFDTPVLGAPTLTDYLYTYDKDAENIEGVQDYVLAYGRYKEMSELVGSVNIGYNKPIYVSYMDKTVDTNVYQFNDVTGEYEIITAGTITNSTLKDFWCIRYDKDTESFVKVVNEDIGYIAARTIKGAYAFNKPFKDAVGRPIYAVLSNELITFAGNKLSYSEYTNSPERNILNNFSAPNLCKIIPIHGDDGYTIRKSTIEKVRLNALEAYTTGYNMLLNNPYEFVDEVAGAYKILGSLTLNADETVDTPIFNYNVGQTIKARINYQYVNTTDKLKLKVEEYDESADNKFKVLQSFEDSAEITSGDKIYYTYTPLVADTILRFTLAKVSDGAVDTTTSTTSLLSIQCGKYEGVQVKNFDLSNCSGMIAWQNCLGIYGLTDDKNTIFFSDVENPGYFPFPNNIITFDNEILAVYNYLDNLLVITVDGVWLVTAGESIDTSVQTRVLTNIHIPEIDAINVQVIKDQIFFKTDHEFYVLKPNTYTSDATNLKNYTNSTAIANFTADFKEQTINLLNQVYRLMCQEYSRNLRADVKFIDFDVIDTNSVTRNEEVHYVYTIIPKLSNDIELNDKLDLHLVYSSIARTWRIYLKAVGDDTVFYNPVLYRHKQSGVFYEFFPHEVSSTTSSLIIAAQTYDVVDDNVTDDTWNLTTKFNNFPYIDTGNVAIDDAFTKRFREIQFNLVNCEPLKIDFYTDFLLDGQERIQATSYDIQHITDILDPDYGQIYITPLETVNLELFGSSALANTTLDSDHWAIDLSRFPDLNVVTIRFRLQGRGRRGAIQLLNTSLKRYELSDINWVYRVMSAR